MTDQKHTKELLPCPFCGSSEVNNTTHPYCDEDDNVDSWVCPDCACKGPFGQSLEQATKNWNTRPQIGDLRRQRDELREACSVLHDIKWQLENSEMHMSDISQFTNEIYHACDILTKTKGDL